MRIPRPPRKRVRIEIIPMIDTMFFLLVFFMVATLSMTLQRGMPVNLPASAEAKADVSDTVTVSVTREGAVYVDEDAVPIDGLAARLRAVKARSTEPSVVVKADADVRHGVVISVLDAIKQAGLTKLAIATKPLQKS